MRYFPLLGLVLVASCLLFWNATSEDLSSTSDDTTIEWLSWEEAVSRMETQPKKIFVDVYTDWCGWCKRMDASTFIDPAVVKQMNEHFYAVKLDAEQKEDIIYDNHTFVYRTDVGRRGVHELAMALLDNRMSYPSFVYLDENRNRITISPGYKDAAVMGTELQFIGADHFKTQTLEAFKATQGK